MAKIRRNEDRDDQDGNLRRSPSKMSDDDEDLPEETEQGLDDDEDNDLGDDQMDEMYYSSISEGVKNREDQDDDEFSGLSIEEGEE